MVKPASGLTEIDLCFSQSSLTCRKMLRLCSRLMDGWGKVIRLSDDKHRKAFSWWLRTGQLPSAIGPDGLELKFNPWHDPTNGRFTSAGAGQHYDGIGDPVNGASDRLSVADSHASGIGQRDRSRLASRPQTGKVRAGGGERALQRATLGMQARRIKRSRPGDRPNAIVEFIGGTGEGLYEVGKETVTGVRVTPTTNPVTTLRNMTNGIAGMIDAAIAAEDAPASVHASRAAAAVANASARDIGHATGAVAGNVALTVAPGAAAAKISALRSLRMMRSRRTYDPLQIGWVKETIRSDKPWKAYNDSATGSRPGQAPTLMRTMPDGSRRPVKFDGFDGDYMTDRKWKVVDAPRARAQLVRQSEVLAEYDAFAT